MSPAKVGRRYSCMPHSIPIANMSSHTLPDIIARLYAKIPEAISSSSSSDDLLPGSVSFGSASTTIILVIVTSTLLIYRSSLKHRLRDVSVHLSDGTVRKLLPQRRTSYWFVDHERLDPAAKSISNISSTAGSETSEQRTQAQPLHRHILRGKFQPKRSERNG